LLFDPSFRSYSRWSVCFFFPFPLSLVPLFYSFSVTFVHIPPWKPFTQPLVRAPFPRNLRLVPARFPSPPPFSRLEYPHALPVSISEFLLFFQSTVVPLFFPTPVFFSQSVFAGSVFTPCHRVIVFPPRCHDHLIFSVACLSFFPRVVFPIFLPPRPPSPLFFFFFGLRPARSGRRPPLSLINCIQLHNHRGNFSSNPPPLEETSFFTVFFELLFNNFFLGRCANPPFRSFFDSPLVLALCYIAPAPAVVHRAFFPSGFPPPNGRHPSSPCAFFPGTDGISKQKFVPPFCSVVPNPLSLNFPYLMYPSSDLPPLNDFLFRFWQVPSPVLRLI